MVDKSSPWDVQFILQDGATYGFMLATPQGQTKQIQSAEAQVPSPERMQTLDMAMSADFSPQVDTPFAMSNFTGGIGQLDYDFGDETKYWWSNGVVTHQSGKVYLAPESSTLTLTGATGGITNTLTYEHTNGTRYDFLWESVNLWRRDASNKTNVWGIVYTASVAITDFKIMDGIGLIAVPTLTGTTDYLTQADVTAAATWVPTNVNHTVFSDALGKPSYFEISRGTCYAVRTLSGTTNGVFYTINPTMDSWLGPIDTTLTGNVSGPPGEDTYPIQWIKAVSDFLFVGRKNAIYSIDSQQDVYETIWQWKDKPSSYNFKYISTGGDLFLFSVGPEVYQYDPQTGQTFPLMLSKQDGFSTKEILGVASDNQYVYVLARVRVPFIRSADSVACLRGVRRSGRTWSFEVVWEDTSLSGKTYGHLSAFPFGVGTRLYWGQDNASDTLTYVMDIPAEWDESTSTTFSSGATLWTSISRAGFQGFNKRHLYMNVNCVGISGSEYIQVRYSTDEGQSFSVLGTTSAAKTEFDFDNVYGSSICMRFDFVGNGSATPTLKNFDHHQRVRFKYLPSVQLAIRIADNLALRNGSRSNLRADEIMQNLVTLRTTTTEITYKDFLGNEFVCTVDSLGFRPTLAQAVNEYEEEAVIVVTRADRGL